MANILVPTDFSAVSKVAVEYAVKIAGMLNGKVSLLHVLTMKDIVRVSMRGKMKGLQKDLIRFAERDMAKLISEVSEAADVRVPIKSSVARGRDFNNAVNKVSKRQKAALIVMGTNGASGLRKTVIGSNTASVIEASKLPVLAVPKHARFRGFRDIVYAADLRNLEKELKTIIPYARQFDSTVHILHITPSGKDVDALEEEINNALKKHKYKKVITLVLVDRFIEGAIDQYLNVSKADLLMMFTHDLTFFDKLFDRSHTRKMAFHSSVPLLAFKQTKVV